MPTLLLVVLAVSGFFNVMQSLAYRSLKREHQKAAGILRDYRHLA